MLTLDQVTDLGGHGGCLSGTGASDNQRVVLIREHHLPLLCIQADERVNRLEDIVQIVLLGFKMPLQERLVVSANTLRTGFQIGDIRIIPQEGFHFSTRHTIGRAVVAERLGRLLILKEAVQFRIILHQVLVVTPCQVLVRHQEGVQGLGESHKPLMLRCHWTGGGKLCGFWLLGKYLAEEGQY